MSTLSPEEQELYDVARVALPKFFFQKDDSTQPVFGAGAKTFKLAKDTIKGWLAQTYILTSTGFWLDQHAIDRGTRRRSGESDAALAARIRQVEDAVTLPALTAAVNAVLTAAGLGNATIVENHSAHAFHHTAADGTSVESFWGRGERWGGGPQLPGSGTRQIIVILPYNTPTSIAAAIQDAMRRKKGAGFAPVTETPVHQYAARGSITPPAAKLQVNVGATQQFTAQFSGLPAVTGVQTWAVDGIVGGNATVGTIDATGLYTAPTAVPSGNGYDHDITCTVAYSGGASAAVGRARMQLFSLTAIPLHTEVLGDSPWLYWRLGTASYTGTTENDASGNARTGVISGSYFTYNPPGGPTLNAPDNQGFTDFNFAWLASTLTPPTAGGFSCEAWVSKDNAIGIWLGDTGQHFFMKCRNADNTWDAGFDLTSFGFGTIGATANGTGGHHVVFTWDTTTAKFYLDGVLKGSMAMAAPAGALANFEINPTHTNSWGGSICEMAVYTTALTATQVLNHYKAGTGQLYS